MRNSKYGIIILFVLMASVFIGSACTSNAQSQPSDEDIIKAIDASGIMKRTDGSITVVPPVTIVERGQRDKDGSWPVKVTFTLTYKMSDGSTSPPTETTTSFRVIRVKDNSGKSVWKAQLGS